jgi:ferredoxin
MEVTVSADDCVDCGVWQRLLAQHHDTSPSLSQSHNRMHCYLSCPIVCPYWSLSMKCDLHGRKSLPSVGFVLSRAI